MLPLKKGNPFCGALGCASLETSGKVYRDKTHGFEVLVHSKQELPADFTVYFAKIRAIDPMLEIEVTEDTSIYESKESTGTFSKLIVDVCAGHGAIGHALSYLGAELAASLDHNSLSAEHLRKSTKAPVIEADIQDLEAVRQIHESLGQRSCTMVAGFPCQPHSTQGRQLGALDARFTALPAIARACGLIRPQALMLDCVEGASTCPEVREVLAKICKDHNWILKEQVLELAHQWPMQRKRWWALLMPAAWAQTDFPTWPKIEPPPRVGDLFTTWPTAAEFEAYTNKVFGGTRKLLLPCDTCPTALHSYSVALRDCPCQCRSKPFTIQTLASKGLRGFFIRSNRTKQPRFLHPHELATLLTVPTTTVTAQACREANCLLGLVAAPLQALWTYSHLLKGASKHITSLGHVKPLEVIAAYKRILTAQAKRMTNEGNDELYLVAIATPEGVPIKILSHSSQTIAHFIDAERIVLNWDENATIKEGALLLPTDFSIGSLQSIESTLERSQKRARLDMPLENVVIAIIHEGEYYFEIIPTGSFIFQALAKLNIQGVYFLTDEDGKIYGADTRVWESHRLFTLASQSFPNIEKMMINFKAAGPAEDIGLSDYLIEFATTSIVYQFAHIEGTSPVLLPVCWLDETDFTASLSQIKHWLPVALNFSDGQIFVPCGEEGHWTLLQGTLQCNGLHWTFYDGLRQEPSSRLVSLAKMLSSLLDEEFAGIENGTIISQKDDYTCGTILLAHLCHCLGLPGDFDDDLIRRLHKTLSRHDLPGAKTAKGPSPAQLARQLADILASKGVPAEAAPQRAQQAVATLGHQAVDNALNSKNPWQLLKAEASKPGKTFQFVTKAELENYIAEKAQHRYGLPEQHKQKKKGKGKGKGKMQNPMPQPHIDPRQLELIKGHFKDTDDDEVPQVSIDEVIHDSTGIALCTKYEALPFISDQKHISSSPHALLVNEDLSNENLGYISSRVIFYAAQIRETNDPVLLSGTLLQLGDEQVLHSLPKDPMKDYEILKTTIVKVQIYRDELPTEWTTLQQAPIRTLLQHIPILILCKQQGCGQQCPHFHQPVDEEAESVIHEIWGRRYQSMTGAVTPPLKADTFQAFLRITHSALEDLLRLNAPGVYFEPRADDMRSTSEAYSVLWLSDSTRDEALHKLRLTHGAQSIVRLKMRYGLRVKKEEEQTAHEQLRPGVTYIKMNVMMTWRLHPLPYGLQRATVLKLLQEWAWTAKPLQPAKGSAAGGAWEVGSEQPPPQPVMTAFGKEVLITLIKDKQHNAPEPKPIVPKRAQQFFNNQGASSSSTTSKQDPWQNPQQDPWMAKPVLKLTSPVQH